METQEKVSGIISQTCNIYPPPFLRITMRYPIKYYEVSYFPKLSQRTKQHAYTNKKSDIGNCRVNFKKTTNHSNIAVLSTKILTKNFCGTFLYRKISFRGI